MTLEYVKLVLPIYLLILLAIIRLKKVIKYLCRKDAENWEKDDCEWYLNTIKVSLIIGLVPIVNIFILIQWIYLLAVDLPDCLLVKTLDKVITTIDSKLTDFINYVFLDKKG